MSNPLSESPDDSEETCGKPCPPERPCDECSGYWQRMIAEGFWGEQQHQWTAKGWKEITKP